MKDALKPAAKAIKPIEPKRFAPRAEHAVLALAFASFFGLAMARWLGFNNQTFDLAFYGRMAWGMVRLDFWDPILNAHQAGLHLSPVLVPVGLLGLIVGTVPALLLTQSLACVLGAHRLGVLGARLLGERGWWIGALAFLLHPNLGHVATYEAHPGTLAVLPLAWAIERLDARSAKGFAWACVGVLACREDLGLVTALLGVLAWRSGMARVGRAVVIGSLAYVALFVVWLHPWLAPHAGSFEAHFGPWGDGFGAMVASFFTDPLRLLAHLFEPSRALYLVLVLAPFVMLPLAAPRWLVPTLPIFGMNLLSHFPTTSQIDSHYLTPALPFLVAATLSALSKIERRAQVEVAVAVALVLTSLAFGVRPRAHLASGPTQDASERIVAAIPADASVQAPDAMLAHLAEREHVYRAPPPDRNADWVVLDLRHRLRYRHREDLLRTEEEPLARTWMARRDYGVVRYDPPWALLRRGADPRAGLEPTEASAEPIRLCACVSVAGVERLDPERVALVLVAHQRCPNDLALRIGDHVELLFDGAVSPAHLRAGDVVRSVHHHPPGELRIAALRSSGAPPAPDDLPVELGSR